MARLATTLAANALAPLGRLKPRPSLEGGLEELRELRPIRSRRLANPVARAVSWVRNSSISSCLDRTSSLAPAGHDTQTASEGRKEEWSSHAISA
jgi:hypothetical protein